MSRIEMTVSPKGLAWAFVFSALLWVLIFWAVSAFAATKVTYPCIYEQTGPSTKVCIAPPKNGLPGTPRARRSTSIRR